MTTTRPSDSTPETGGFLRSQTAARIADAALDLDVNELPRVPRLDAEHERAARTTAHTAYLRISAWLADLGTTSRRESLATWAKVAGLDGKRWAGRISAERALKRLASWDLIELRHEPEHRDRVHRVTLLDPAQRPGATSLATRRNDPAQVDHAQVKSNTSNPDDVMSNELRRHDVKSDEHRATGDTSPLIAHNLTGSDLVESDTVESIESVESDESDSSPTSPRAAAIAKARALRNESEAETDDGLNSAERRHLLAMRLGRRVLIVCRGCGVDVGAWIVGDVPAADLFERQRLYLEPVAGEAFTFTYAAPDGPPHDGYRVSACSSCPAWVAELSERAPRQRTTTTTSEED